MKILPKNLRKTHHGAQRQRPLYLGDDEHVMALIIVLSTVNVATATPWRAVGGRMCSQGLRSC